MLSLYFKLMMTSNINFHFYQLNPDGHRGPIGQNADQIASGQKGDTV